jgi:hypothetical protein
MPDDHGVGHAKGADDTGNVSGLRTWVVTLGCVIGSAVTAKIHGDSAVASIGEVDELLPPRPPERGKPVEQQDRRAVTEIGDVEPRSVR